MPLFVYDSTMVNFCTRLIADNNGNCCLAPDEHIFILVDKN